MLTYAIKRISLAVVILFTVMLAMYAMVFLVPGDPASLALGPRAVILPAFALGIGWVGCLAPCSCPCHRRPPAHRDVGTGCETREGHHPCHA
jgi:hypothetical protein